MKGTDWDLLSVLTGTMMLALALTRFLEIPLRPLLNAMILGSPLGINLSAPNLILLLILGLAMTGTAVFLRSHPQWEQADIKHSTMHWIVPSLLCMALAAWLDQMAQTEIWVVALLASAVLIPIALLVEYGELNRAIQPPSWRKWVLTTLIHLIAVILFTLLYNARTRSMLSGTAVFIIATLLAARLFWSSSPNLARVFQYGGFVGLGLGQLMWALNYWRLSGLQGGLILLLLFYLLTGLLQQYLLRQFEDGRNGRAILIEYGSVVVVGLIIVFSAVP